MKERLPCGDDQGQWDRFSVSKQYVSVSHLHVWKILHLRESRGGVLTYVSYIVGMFGLIG